MACICEAEIDIADPDHLARFERLDAAIGVLAIARPRKRRGARRSEERLVARAAVIGMGMGDDRARDRADGVDVEPPNRTVEPRLGHLEKIARLHVVEPSASGGRVEM